MDEKLTAAIDAIWGTTNDAALWDGVRTYGNRWAARYLIAALLAGVDLRDDADRAKLIADLQDVAQS